MDVEFLRYQFEDGYYGVITKNGEWETNVNPTHLRNKLNVPLNQFNPYGCGPLRVKNTLRVKYD